MIAVLIKRRQKGFTLIELLVVIAMLGILVAGTMVLINPMQLLGKARDAQRKNALKQIQTALEAYHNDYGKYPSMEWVNSVGGGLWIPGLTQKYIKVMPVDPKNICAGYVIPRDNVNCFTYAYYSGGWCGLNGATDGYILTTRLEQYPSSDLSQKPYYNTDGTLCSNWTEDPVDKPGNPVNGLYTVSNP